MGPLEIIIIVAAVLIVAGVIGMYIARKLKGKPTGDCAGCPYACDCKTCHSISADKRQNADGDV